jgi:biopolymer transport protein TolR
MLKLKRNKRSIMMSEINIIPFTDILLVVLIAFIVTTPLLIQSSIKVKLPKVDLNSTVTKENIININITDRNKIYLDDREIPDLNFLEAAFDKMAVSDKVIVVSADENINYGLVAKVLGLAKNKGAVKLELAIDNINQKINQ